MPSLSEAEEAYTALPGGTADISHLQAERQRSRMRLSSVARLEQVSSQRLAHLAFTDVSPYSAYKDILPQIRCLYPFRKRLPLLTKGSGLRGTLCSAARIKQDVFPKYSNFRRPAPV